MKIGGVLVNGVVWFDLIEVLSKIIDCESRLVSIEFMSSSDAKKLPDEAFDILFGIALFTVVKGGGLVNKVSIGFIEKPESLI